MSLEERPKVGDIIRLPNAPFDNLRRDTQNLCIVTEVGHPDINSVILLPLNPAIIQKLITDNYGIRTPKNGEFWRCSYADLELVKSGICLRGE